MPSNHDLLIQWLRQFNWQERYHLVDHALDADGFKLGSPFREQLGDEIGIRIPENAFAAMDYHLDWLYAALTLSAQGIETDGHWDAPANVATGKQLDTDLLVVFKDSDQSHVITVEAKAKGAWDNKQMKNKVRRLTEIFGDDGDRWSGFTPHWVLMSPRQTRNYAMKDWPAWMKNRDEEPYWIGLKLPKCLSTLHQADRSGNPSKDGPNFVVLTKDIKVQK